MKLFPVLYFVVLLVHLVAGALEYTQLAAITKPALLSALVIFFALNQRTYGGSKFSVFVLFGLILSLAGDVLLMFQEIADYYFTLGLAAFLLAHISYSIAFTKTYRDDHEIELLKRRGWVLLVVIAYGYLFFDAIKSNLGGFMAPVILYIIAIVFMMLMALNRYKRVGTKSFWLIFAGALFFLASDSILAWNKFMEEIDHSHLLIMGTYGIAQFLITLGAVYQIRETAVYR